MEENKNHRASESAETGGVPAEPITGAALTEGADKLPSENDGGRTASEDQKRDGEFACVALRYRKGDQRLRYAGIVVAAVVLLAAVLIACMAAGRHNGAAGEETTAEPSDSTAESNADSTPEGADSELHLYEFDPSLVPEGHIALIPADLSGSSDEAVNLTEHALDLAAIRALWTNETEAAVSGSPLVLILHTHTTEGYSPDKAVSYDGTGDFARSQTDTENMIAVGAVLAETLNGAGIGAVHCTLYHDLAEDGTVSYEGSYGRAAETIAHYRALYPSIRYVIDLHRDTVFDTDGNALRAVTAADGEAVAQMMAVVGGGSEGWEQELSLALALTDRLNADGTALCRAPTLKASALNGETADFVLTVEMGTAANSLSEAQRAARLLGEALSELIGGAES